MAEKETTRTEAFSDGIFAIAITLLILDLRAPEAGTSAELWRKLGQLWPGYVAYLMSFTIIGIMWMNHHLIFRHIQRVDYRLTMYNVLLMLTIAFLPFPTGVLAHNIADPGTCTAATVFYSATMLLTSIPYSCVWLHAVKADLVEGDPAAVTTVLAFFAPLTAIIVIGLSSLYWLIFPAWRRQR